MTVGQGVLFTLVMIIGVTLTHVHTLYFLFFVIIFGTMTVGQGITHAYKRIRIRIHAHTRTHTHACTYTPQKNAKKIDMND